MFSTYYNRRAFLASLAAVAAAQNTRISDTTLPDSIKSLKPMTDGVQPITDAERAARIEKARRLMRQNRLAAIYLPSGSSMFYFTGKRQAGQGWILSSKGEPVWTAADPPSIARSLKDAGLSTGAIGLEEQTPFALVAGLGNV